MTKNDRIDVMTLFDRTHPRTYPIAYTRMRNAVFWLALWLAFVPFANSRFVTMSVTTGVTPGVTHSVTPDFTSITSIATSATVYNVTSESTSDATSDITTNTNTTTTSSVSTCVTKNETTRNVVDIVYHAGEDVQVICVAAGPSDGLMHLQMATPTGYHYATISFGRKSGYNSDRMSVERDGNILMFSIRGIQLADEGQYTVITAHGVTEAQYNLKVLSLPPRPGKKLARNAKTECIQCVPCTITIVRATKTERKETNEADADADAQAVAFLIGFTAAGFLSIVTVIGTLTLYDKFSSKKCVNVCGGANLEFDCSILRKWCQKRQNNQQHV